MKQREAIRHELDFKAKATIIIGILLAFAVMMIPLWQNGKARTITLRTMAAEERIQSLENEERYLLSSISETGRNSFAGDVVLALRNN